MDSNNSRLEAEHLAFEEAALLVKAYRRQWKAARTAAITFAALFGSTLGVLLWMILS